jgi:hypothetical protein
MGDCLPQLDDTTFYGPIGAGNGDMLQVPGMGSAGLQ